MNRIKSLFQQKSHSILSVYFTAGFPELESTLPILRALQSNGVDLVEIGIPFSDPLADGIVIQQSNHVALCNGMSLKKLFEQLQHMRSEINIPVILMGYLNPIMQFGFEAFCKECQKSGVDGLIIPDLPLAEYLSEYQAIALNYQLECNFLITPETSDERIRTIDTHTNGFIYMVSSAAVTGAQQSFENRLSYFEKIKQMQLKNPQLIGFGVSNKATFDAANRYAAGAIVGSAFVKILQSGVDADTAVKQLLAQLRRD